MNSRDCYEENSEDKGIQEEQFTLQEFEELSLKIEHDIREIRKLVNHAVYLKINSATDNIAGNCDKSDFLRVSKDLIKMSDRCQKLSHQLNSLLHSLYD